MIQAGVSFGMQGAVSRLIVVVGMVVLVSLGSPAGAQSPGSGETFLPGFSVGGHLHAIATGQTRDFQKGDSSETSSLDVNSVEFGVTASPREQVDATVVWLLEEGFNSGRPSQGFAVDQAFVTIAGNKRVLSDVQGRESLDESPFYLRAGKFYVPFGTNLKYHTFDVISEPQSLGLSETLETSLMVGYTPGDRLNLYGGVYGGSGPDRSSSDPGETLDDGFLGAELSSGSGTLALQWTNNISNSIALNNEISGDPGAVGGLAAYGSLALDPARLQLEYVSALEDYDRGNFAENQPFAVSSELTVEDLGRIRSRPVDFTLVYGATDEWIDHPETTGGVVVDVQLLDGVTGSAEVLSRDYDPNFSSRLEDETLASFRLAADFSYFLSQNR